MRNPYVVGLVLLAAATGVAGADLSLPSSVALTPGQQVSYPVTLSQPAPSGGVFVSLATSDPSKVTISPANILIPQGMTTTSRAPQLTAVAYGSSTITASAYNFTGDSKTVTVVGSGAIMLPGATVKVGQTAAYPITLSSAAPSGGVTVSLSVGDASKIALSSTNIFISGGYTTPSVQPQITGLTSGSVAITASASGYASANDTIQVQPAQVSATLTFSATNVNIPAGGTANLLLNLSTTAPAGGMVVNLTLSSTGVATAPASVTIPAGLTTVNVPVTGVAAGTATISANTSAPNVSGTSATVTVTSGEDMTLPPGTVVAPGQQVSFPVTLVQPAPSGGVFVNLASSDPSKVTISPSSILIPQGSTTNARAPQLTGVGVGSASVTASAYNMRSATASVLVGTAHTLSPATVTITGIGVSQSLTLTLSSPAPAGGLLFSLSSSNPGVVSVPASVSVAANNSSATIPVTSVSGGTAVIHSSCLPSFADTTSTVTVVSSASISLPSGITLAPGQSAAFPVTIGTAAPASGVTVILVSSDSSKVTISSPTVFIPAGSTAPSVQPQVAGVALGSANISASASGYVTATQAVQVKGALSFSPQSISITGTAVQSTTLSISAASPTAVTVTLNSSNPAVATAPSAVTIGAGATSVSVPVTGVAAGSATITASAANVTNGTATVTVTSTNPGGAVILPSNVQLAPNQPAPFPVTLSVAAPAGGVTVTLTSSAGLVTITPTVFVPAGAVTPSTQPQIVGTGFGTATITASAPGYTPASQSVRVAGTLSFSPSTVNFTGLGTNSVQLNLSVPAPAALAVNLASNNTSVATVPATATIAANSSSINVPVTATGAGSAVITATTSFATVSAASANVAVTLTRDIILPSGVIVAPGQQVAFPITLSKPAPSGGVFISLTSSDTGKVTITPLNILIPQGATTTVQSPMLNGVSIGSATISAASYNMTGSSETVVVSSGSPAFGFSPTSLTMTGIGSTQTLVVTLPVQAPAGGLTVTLSSSNPSVATAPSSVVVAAGSRTANVQVTATGTGTATIMGGAPGYPNATASVTVAAAQSILLPANPTCVLGQPVAFDVKLAQPAPTGGVTITFTSTDYNTAAITPMTAFVPAGSTVPDVQLRLIGYVVGTATISASAPGYATASQLATVTGNTSNVAWHGACWYSGTIYGRTGKFQAIDFVLSGAPATLQGTLFYTSNCDPKDGVDNMNDYDSLTYPSHTVEGFTYHPDVIPSSAIFWVGPRTADGKCAPGSPCSGCVTYTAATPDCRSMP